MSLACVFMATDGLLVLADGRTLTAAGGWAADDTRKLVLSPDQQPLAVALVGRATYALRPVADVVEGALRGYAGEQPRKGLTPHFVAERLLEDLERMGSCHPHSSGMSAEALVCGFADGAPGVWRIGTRATIDSDSADDDPLALQELSGQPQAVPLADEGWAAIPAETDAGAALASKIDIWMDHVDGGHEPIGDTYELRDLALTTLAQEVLTRLRRAVVDDSAAFDACGVGGLWTVAALRPGAQPEVTVHQVGPFRPRSA